MKIGIQTRGINQDVMVREFIHRKITFALRRLDRNVESVAVRLEFGNPGTASLGGVCHIDLKLIGAGEIHVFSNGLSASDCVLQATRKMEFAMLQSKRNENPAPP